MSDSDLGLERRVAAAMHRAGTRGPDPMPDVLGVVRRSRRRRSRVAATAVAVLLVVGAVGASAAMRSRGDGQGDIRSGRPSAPPTSAGPPTPTTSTGASVQPVSVDRPVLDQCTPTRALQQSATGAPFSVPIAPYEMYAVPDLGPTGPLVAVTRSPTQGGVSSTDGNTGGLRANDEIDGRDLTLQPAQNPGERAGASWDTADGGNAHLYASGVDASELRAVVEALDQGDPTLLPGGLVPIGSAGHVEWSQSDCYDGRDLLATITTFRGDAPSRWAYVLGNTPGNVAATILDDGATSTVIFGLPGRYDASNAAFHQATPEEWIALLAVSERPPFAPPPTTTTTRPR